MTNDVDKTFKDLTMDYVQLNIFVKVCEEDIKEFRRELNVYLDKIELNILKELDDKGTHLAKTIESQKTTLSRLKLSVDKDIKSLEDANCTDRKYVMFASNVNISKALKAYDSTLSELAES